MIRIRRSWSMIIFFQVQNYSYLFFILKKKKINIVSLKKTLLLSLKLKNFPILNKNQT